MRIFKNSVRFPEELSGGRSITQIFKTYPIYVKTAAVALQGIDYGFSDTEGMFFRCTIDANARIINPYEVRVTITFGLRSREFDKKTDAIINYALFIN